MNNQVQPRAPRAKGMPRGLPREKRVDFGGGFQAKPRACPRLSRPIRAGRKVRVGLKNQVQPRAPRAKGMPRGLPKKKRVDLILANHRQCLGLGNALHGLCTVLGKGSAFFCPGFV